MRGLRRSQRSSFLLPPKKRTAILSVRSQQKDQFSKTYQQATKTLLNVSPRNIFLVWSMVSIGVTNRLQPMPASILTLLP